jgi:BRCA1 C Terminus (BRCT) domain
MSLISRTFGALKPEHRVDLASAIRPQRRLPNSNDDVQPNIGRILTSERRIATRNMDELIGMCRMVLADGHVDDMEANFLLNWIETHYHAKDVWPGNILYERLSHAMVQGHIDPGEESELLEVLGKVAGGPPTGDQPSVSGAIPFDNPPPRIVYPNERFVLTGQFAYGPRKRVEEVIESRGGECTESVSKMCGYLIVGTFGSEEWLHSNFGTKIAKAVEMKSAGKPVRIVTEQHWAESLT